MNTQNPLISTYVLVVDDDVILQSLMVILLETLGYKVTVVSTVADARVLLNTFLFDLVLLDMNLPDGSGLSLLTARPMTNDHPLMIVMTVDDTATTVTRALRGGAFDYITKPVNTEIIRRTLQRATEHVTLQRADATLAELKAQTIAMRATAEAAVHHLSQDLSVIMTETQLMEQDSESGELVEASHRIMMAVRHAASTLTVLRHAQCYVTMGYPSEDAILDIVAAAGRPIEESA